MCRTRRRSAQTGLGGTWREAQNEAEYDGNASCSRSASSSLVDCTARRTAGGYDELLDAGRRACGRAGSRLLDGLDALDPSAELDAHATARINRRVRETGIAYDMFADPTESAQPWQLDLVPIVFSPRGVALARGGAGPARAAVRRACSPICTARSS